jgi:hypothetical protein
VMYCSLAMAYVRGREEGFRPPLLRTLVPFFLWTVVQVINPNSPSVFYGLLGLKLYFFYVPLIFIGYALIRTELDLRKFLIVNMSLAGVIALVGIMQSVLGLKFLNPAQLPPDLEMLGTQVRYTSAALEVVRPNSVFVSDGRFAQYMLLMFILGLGSAAYFLLQRARGGKIIFPALGLVFVAQVMSGSRGGLGYTAAAIMAIGSGLVWGLQGRRVAEASRLVRGVRRAVLIAGLGTAMMLIMFPKESGAHLAYYRETMSPDSPYYEAGGRAWDYPIANFNKAFSYPDWRMGYGTGTNSLGTQYVSRFTGTEDPSRSRDVESAYGSLVIELGILGLLLWLLWTVDALSTAGKIVSRLRTAPSFPIALSILVFSFILLFPFMFMGVSVYQNYLPNAYFWICLGVLFRLPKVEELKRAQTPQPIQVGRP